MRSFKKRTIALVLASVVTVVGAFGAENYKNSLTGIKFEGSSGSNVNLIVQTKMAYEGNVAPIRKDANTYILTLPEMNSIASTPDLKEVSSQIANINIRTMPYSNNAKGYTRITIKTLNPSLNLVATNQVFIGNSQSEKLLTTRENDSTRYQSNFRKEEPRQYKQKTKNYYEENLDKQVTESALKEVPIETVVSSEPASTLKEVDIVEEKVTNYSKPSSDNTYFWLWGLLIVLGSAFFYSRAKNKMQEIAGEKIDINVTEDDKLTKRKSLKKIKNVINTLDSAYSKTATASKQVSYVAPAAPVKKTKPAEELNIVDLDELFQEHKAKTSTKTKEEEENDALEEFLSGFSFDDSEEIAQMIEEDSFNEELYERVISNASIKFTKDDLLCINKLLSTEINDDTIRNIDNYAISNPIKKIQSKNEVLEDLLTEYAISQNILFKQSDVETLRKLINIELDTDFITDLRTNPQKSIQMEKDILTYGDKPKKPSEIITLSVKDMLPDLSEALKLQGNKKIESNHKAETIYFSDGYDVKTLSLDFEMPDLSKEINKKDAYASKPSAEIQIVDENYTVGNSVLKASSSLPDLSDVLANPDKYTEAEPEEVVVNAEALLNNITNVQFKPFYDGTNEFEVLNDLSDIPSVSDIEAELNLFESFEITKEEAEAETPIQEEFDDFKAIYSNEYVDLDKKETQSPANTESAQDLIKKIEQTKSNRETRRAEAMKRNITPKKESSNQPVEQKSIKCILEGETYTVISSAQFEENKGCYLAKNEKGYAVLGYIGDKLIKLQHYNTLKSEKIHTRLSEKLEEGARYLIRVGLQKLIVNVTENDIKFVMDLC